VAKYAVGDEIDVRFTGIIRGIDDSPLLGECYRVESKNSMYEHHIFVDADCDGEEDFVRGNPEYWPPKPGDLWATPGGTLYFAKKSSSADMTLLTPSDAGGSSVYNDSFLKRFPEAHLVFRNFS